MDGFDLTGLIIGGAALAFQFWKFWRAADGGPVDKYDDEDCRALSDWCGPSEPAEPTATTVRLRMPRTDRRAS